MLHGIIGKTDQASTSVVELEDDGWCLSNAKEKKVENGPNN
jgi:hypothetical protein